MTDVNIIARKIIDIATTKDKNEATESIVSILKKYGEVIQNKNLTDDESLLKKFALISLLRDCGVHKNDLSVKSLETTVEYLLSRGVDVDVNENLDKIIRCDLDNVYAHYIMRRIKQITE